VPLDDPGWGGYVPKPGDEQPPPLPAPPEAPSATPSSSKRPLLIAALGVAAVAAVIVAAVVATSGGSGSKHSAAATTTAVLALLSKAEFVRKADSICLSYRAQVEQLGAAGDNAQLAQVGQAEIDALRALGEPAQDAELIRSMLNFGAQAVNYLMIGDTASANTAIVQSDTAAGQFGMQVCNYGH
jgi:hypothetical protein